MKVIVGHLASGLGYLVLRSTSHSLMHRTKFVVCHATPRTSDTTHERTWTSHCRPHGAGGQAGDHTGTHHLRLRADWIGSGVWTKPQREGRAGDHTKQVNVHQSRSRTDEADEPGKWHAEVQNAERPLSVSPSLPVQGREAIQRNTDRTQTA